MIAQCNSYLRCSLDAMLYHVVMERHIARASRTVKESTNNLYLCPLFCILNFHPLIAFGLKMMNPWIMWSALSGTARYAVRGSPILVSTISGSRPYSKFSSFFLSLLRHSQNKRFSSFHYYFASMRSFTGLWHSCGGQKPSQSCRSRYTLSCSLFASMSILLL